MSSPTRTGKLLMAAAVAGAVLAAAAVAVRLSLLRTLLPAALLVTLVVFAVGLHRVLWAPPRDTARVAPAFRVPVTVAAACAAWLALGAAIGVGLGFAMRWRHLHGGPASAFGARSRDHKPVYQRPRLHPGREKLPDDER